MRTPRTGKLRLVSSDADRAGVALLAREIGATLRGDERDVPVIPLYVCELLDQMDWLSLSPSASAHPIRSLARVMSWSFRKNMDDRVILIAQAGEFATMIRRVDEEDGWPTDGWLHALVVCCLAVELSLEDPPHSRWPAEAGVQVAGLVLRSPSGSLLGDLDAWREDRARRHAWMRERLTRARERALAL